MSNVPAFASTPIVGYADVPSGADTSYTAPATTTTATFAPVLGANGSKITEVDYMALGSTLNGLVNVFLFDGSAYHLVDTVTITASTASTTAAGNSYKKLYNNFFVPNGWSIRVTSTVGSQLIGVRFYGGNF